MKNIKLCCVVVLGLLSVMPAQASENWFTSLFPWVVVSGGGLGGGDPGVEPVMTTAGGGAGGGDPGVDPE